MRKRAMPVLEEMPIAEKVRRGNVIVRSRVRDAEDSLAQLVHDDDQVVAATAIHFVESRRLWSLADDLEYALAHRDARHWHVFEAASWALAARRMPAEERPARPRLKPGPRPTASPPRPRTPCCYSPRSSSNRRNPPVCSAP